MKKDHPPSRQHFFRCEGQLRFLDRLAGLIHTAVEKKILNGVFNSKQNNRIRVTGSEKYIIIKNVSHLS